MLVLSKGQEVRVAFGHTIRTCTVSQDITVGVWCDVADRLMTEVKVSFTGDDGSNHSRLVDMMHILKD